MEMILVGPIGHKGRWDERQDVESRELQYKGFRFIARAKRGPVGWIGELTVLLPQDESPVHAWVQVPRFHADPVTAIREAHLQGILSVDQGEIIRL